METESSDRSSLGCSQDTERSLTKDIWKYLQSCIIRSVALGCSGKYARHNEMTEKEKQKRLDECAYKTQAEAANSTHLRIIREWKVVFIFPLVFPSTCLLQQMINFGVQECVFGCLVFSFAGLWPLTRADHQSASETHQTCAYLN